ncbi:MAG: hypothetical protein EZS26_001546 [Candidatus Ordinivivax streblomastigis]|uniref:Type I restriction modification DNA specificity domain-containing protein n=1 Tax=Candidatus Ordinivivax streblomastigis TaxID=2540710 RepID=A0A5M8P1F1_9BACT|nr:MAG: hypothetical protein EZS26_001546 [Candidatus Ordinivivax streblomastigis]
MNSTYTIQNKNFDKNRVFILQNSELEKRLDPSWYVYLKSVNSFRYNKIALKKLLLENPQYGANEIGIIRNNISEPRYIRITDINEFGELDKDFGKTASLIEDKYILEENDLLLARSGNTVGKSYLHKDVGYECFFAGYMIRFKIDAEKVLPQYVFAYTQTTFYKNWVKAIQRATGQPNINAEEYRNLEIPLPNIEIQNKVVEFLNQALEKKKQYEIQSEKLLASIDDYLLGELGITLPAENDYSELSVQQQGFELNKQNSLVKKGRLFLTMYSKTENRIDPEYYRLYYYKLFNEIKNILHCKLKDLTQLIDYGLMPTQDYAADENSGIPFIRVTNILPSGEIDMSDIKYIPFDTPRIEQKRVKENDILMVQCGSTTGKVAIVPKEYENYLANSFSFIIRSNENIRQDFLFYVLGSRIVQMQIVRSQNIVSVRPNTSKPAVENLLIPLPILEQQTKIAEHISEIRQQAKHLQNEAKNILENAKREIEKIILGK